MLTIKSNGKLTRKFKIPKGSITAKKVVPVVVVNAKKPRKSKGKVPLPKTRTLSLTYNESISLISGSTANVLGAPFSYNICKPTAPKSNQAVGNFIPQGLFDQVGKYTKYKVVSARVKVTVTEDSSRSAVVVFTPVNSQDLAYTMLSLQVASASMKPNSFELLLGREGKIRTYSRIMYPNVIDSISRSAYTNDFDNYEGNVTTTLAGITSPTRLPQLQFAIANTSDATQMTYKAFVEIIYKVRFYQYITPVVQQSL